MALTSTFIALALSCAPQVHSQTMAKLAHIESSFGPFRININGRMKLSRQPKTKQEAVAVAQKLMELNLNFDAGYVQVNSSNFEPYGLSLDDIFDPCRNLTAGQDIFLACFDKDLAAAKESMQYRLKRAASCYNTGSYTRGFANGYVQKFVGPLPSVIP